MRCLRHSVGPPEGGRRTLGPGRQRDRRPAGEPSSRPIGNWLEQAGGPCEIVTEPAVATRIRAHINLRVPDLGVDRERDVHGRVQGRAGGVEEPPLLHERLGHGGGRSRCRNEHRRADQRGPRTSYSCSSFAASPWASSVRGRRVRGCEPWPADLSTRRPRGAPVPCGRGARRDGSIPWRWRRLRTDPTERTPTPRRRRT